MSTPSEELLWITDKKWICIENRTSLYIPSSGKDNSNTRIYPEVNSKWMSICDLYIWLTKQFF